MGWTKSRRGVASTWWTSGPRTLRTRVDIEGIACRLRDPGGFVGFDLKIVGEVVFVFGPQASGEDDLRTTYGVIGQLASRRNNFMKVTWSSDALKAV